jgi:hypothetical protein
MPAPRYVPPGPPPREPTGREIAVHIPYSSTALALRKRAAPDGWFDGARKLWILPPEDAQAVTAAVIRAFRRCLEQRGDIPTAHTGKLRALRDEMRDLRAILGALKRDKRVWTPELRQEYEDLRAELGE